MMTVGRITEKTEDYQNCSVLCCVPYDNCAHTYEQFLQLDVDLYVYIMQKAVDK